MYALNYTQVGKNISLLISQRGMTQQSLADKLGISKQVMSKIIRGCKAINVAELFQIASVLGSSTDALLTVECNDVASKPDLAFMGGIKDEEALEKVELLREAIDQIHLLEGLANG